MALYIKDDSIAALARELAKRRRCTVSELVRRALEAERDRAAADEAARDAELKSIQAHFRAAWPDASSNHDFMYDEEGSPVL
jgi:hypothetical protein